MQPFDFSNIPLGTLLARLRVDRGLSQNDVALATGYSRSYITRIEGGQKPSEAALQKIASALQMTQLELNVMLGTVTHADIERMQQINAALGQLPPQVLAELQAAIGDDTTELVSLLQKAGGHDQPPQIPVEPPEGWSDLNNSNRRLVRQLIAKLVLSQSAETE